MTNDRLEELIALLGWPQPIRRDLNDAIEALRELKERRLAAEPVCKCGHSMSAHDMQYGCSHCTCVVVREPVKQPTECQHKMEDAVQAAENEKSLSERLRNLFEDVRCDPIDYAPLVAEVERLEALKKRGA